MEWSRILARLSRQIAPHPGLAEGRLAIRSTPVAAMVCMRSTHARCLRAGSPLPPLPAGDRLRAHACQAALVLRRVPKPSAVRAKPDGTKRLGASVFCQRRRAGKGSPGHLPLDASKYRRRWRSNRIVEPQRGTKSGRPRAAGPTNHYQPARTSILRGRNSARFGMRTVSTPSLRLASIRSVSSSPLRTKLRRYRVACTSA